MFIVVWSTKVDDGNNYILVDHWAAHNHGEDAMRHYEKILLSPHTWSATICDRVLVSTDFEEGDLL
jgi:hypothetical protein